MPALSFAGTIGLQNSQVADLFNVGQWFTNLAANLLVPIFDGDRRQSNITLAEARFNEVDIAAEISGRVVSVEPSFQSGGRIRQGQPSFRIEDADYRNRVEQVRTDIAVQQVEILRVQEEARLARAQYEQFRRYEAGDRGLDPGFD